MHEDRAAQVLAVVVLYGLSPQESPALQSLLGVVAQLAAASAIACVVYDNSPVAHEAPQAQFACTYRHDPSNPGLAMAYQYALERAERAGVPWLMLLDQDTTITTAFLAEALQAINDLRERRAVGALAPKLIQDGMVLSPHWPHGHPSRESFEARFGILEPGVRVYNSGALLRVQAVRAAGGFPLDFPLDYLDHAMFARLQAQQRQVFLLHAALPHQLASKSLDVSAALPDSRRLQGTLAAEARFYRQYGSLRDRLLLWRRRAKLGFSMVRQGRWRSLSVLLRCTL